MDVRFGCMCDQTSTSACQTMASATANARVRTRRAAIHAATVQLVGPTMERKAAKVCVCWAV